MNQQRMIMGNAPDENKSKKSIVGIIAVIILVLVIGALAFSNFNKDKKVASSQEKEDSLVVKNSQLQNDIKNKNDIDAEEPLKEEFLKDTDKEMAMATNTSETIESQSKEFGEDTLPKSDNIEGQEVHSFEVAKSVEVPEAEKIEQAAVVEKQQNGMGNDEAILPNIEENEPAFITEQVENDSDKTKPENVNDDGTATISDTNNRENVYVVKPGDYLWKISGDPEVLNDPFKWGLVYKANRHQINDPDLIYVGQELIIPTTN